jgi:myosin heavy subunit
MDSENSSNSPFLGSHLPITLLGVAFSLFFLSQLQEANVEASGLENQKTATIKAHESLKKQIDKNFKELEDRKAAVAQSEKIQEDFANESKTVKERTTSTAQFEQLHKQLIDMNALRDQMKPKVEESQKIQQQFTDLMKDLDSLKRLGDKDADAILSAFGIQINDPAKGEAKPEEKKP